MVVVILQVGRRRRKSSTEKTEFTWESAHLTRNVLADGFRYLGWVFCPMLLEGWAIRVDQLDDIFQKVD